MKQVLISAALILLCTSFAAPKKTSIQFVFFNNCDKKLQTYLAENVAKFYNCDVEITTSINLPSSAYYKPRNRYRADSLLEFLKSQKTSRYDKVIGFTNKDISTTKGEYVDFGVFGMGFCPGPSCIVSSYRLKSDPVKCLDVVLHEAGHTFGLPHCPSPGCLMADAKGGPVKVTKEGSFLCKSCKNKM